MNNMIATATTATISQQHQQQPNLDLSLKLYNPIKQEPFSMTGLIEVL
jgi:hypothetical protein